MAKRRVLQKIWVVIITNFTMITWCEPWSQWLNIVNNTLGIPFLKSSQHNSPFLESKKYIQLKVSITNNSLLWINTLGIPFLKSSQHNSLFLESKKYIQLKVSFTNNALLWFIYNVFLVIIVLSAQNEACWNWWKLHLSHLARH